MMGASATRRTFMPRLTRRNLLGSTAAMLAFAAAPGHAAIAGAPPVAPIRPVTETYFGVKVTDRYRWMESEDPEWQAYVRAQGAYAARILDKIPGRAQLAAAIAHDTGEVVSVIAIRTGGGKIFAQVRPARANTSNLFVRDGISGADRKLVDPDSFATAASHAALAWGVPSPDGSHVVFGISSGGSEQSTLHILVTATGALLPETIDRTAYADPSWLPDGTGLFYNRLRDVSPNSVGYEEKSLCWFHRLGTDPATDVKVLGQGLSPAVQVADADFPNVSATPGS